MGKIKKLLSEKLIKDKSHYYNDFFTVEVCENFHIHWRNIRWQMLLPEWEVFSPSLMKAYKRWELLDKPYPEPETIYLQNAYTKLPNSQFDSNRTAIELQDVGYTNLPSVHFHYKSLRIDWNIKELKEIIELFKDAEKTLNELEKKGMFK